MILHLDDRFLLKDLLSVQETLFLQLLVSLLHELIKFVLADINLELCLEDLVLNDLLLLFLLEIILVNRIRINDLFNIVDIYFLFLDVKNLLQLVEFLLVVLQNMLLDRVFIIFVDSSELLLLILTNLVSLVSNVKETIFQILVILLNLAIKLLFLDEILLNLTENLLVVLFLLVLFDLIASVNLLKDLLFILELVHLQNQMVNHVVIVGKEVVELRHSLLVLKSVDSAQFDHDLVSLLKTDSFIVDVELLVVLLFEVLDSLDNLLIFELLVINLVFELFPQHF